MDKLTVIVIILALFVQLASISRTNEPYPAILLPGGGSLLKDSNRIPVREYQMIAYQNDSTYQLVDKKQLLNTMPESYNQYVIRNMLGLPVNEVAARYANQAHVVKGKRWLQSRLKEITNFDHVNTLELLLLEKQLFLSENEIDSVSIDRVRSITNFDLNHADI